MTVNGADFHIFTTHAEADKAIRALTHANFDVTKLSLIGKGYHTEEHPAVFFLPGIGLLAMAGPVVAMLVSALEGAVVVGGISALGVALLNSGLNKEEVIRYETALKADEYVLMVHGNAEDIRVARAVVGDRAAVA